MAKNYSNTAVQTALASGVTSSSPSIIVGSTVGFPAVQFTLVIDPGTAKEELVLVTAVAGTTLSVTRGYDGTTAVAHDTGAVIQHSHSAIDFATSRAHEAATAGVHGVTGGLVGTTDTQTLTNKTISADNNTLSGIAASSFVVSNASGNVDGAAAQKVIPAGVVVGTTDTQTLTNKTLGSTNTLNGFTASQLLSSDGTGKAVASGKSVPTGAVVGTTDAQTLTSKTLTSPAMTDPTASGSLTGFGGAWTAYTPTWGGNTAIGNGTLVGKYMKIGKTVLFRIVITMGSTTTYGDSAWSLSLPVAPVTSSEALSFLARYIDTSAGGSINTSVGINPATGLLGMLAPPTTAGNFDRGVTSTVPFTWASGDIVSVSGTYEAA